MHWRWRGTAACTPPPARPARPSRPSPGRSPRLEADLGAPLFERHARGVRPNEYGRRFLVHARAMVAEARSAREAVAQMLGLRQGRVVFGISVAALREGEVDFLICPLPAGSADPQFEVSPLMRSQMVLVARRGHPRARARSLAALAGSPFVVGGPRGQPGAGIYELLEGAGLDAPRIELRTDGLIDTIAMVAATDCLALLPSALLRSGLLRERLVRVPVRGALPSYQVGLFRRAAVPPTPAAHRLAVEFEREAAYLGGGAAAPAGPSPSPG